MATTLREQLENELAAAENALEFARKVDVAWHAIGGGSFEMRLLAAGVDQLTADQLATGNVRRPSVASASRLVGRIRARIAGLDRYEANKGASK